MALRVTEMTCSLHDPERPSAVTDRWASWPTLTASLPWNSEIADLHARQRHRRTGTRSLVVTLADGHGYIATARYWPDGNREHGQTERRQKCPLDGNYSA